MLIELAVGVRPTVETTVKRKARRVKYRYTVNCRICFHNFVAARPSAKCCSPRCRKQMSRFIAAEKAAAEKAAAEEKAKKAAARKKRAPAPKKKK